MKKTKQFIFIQWGKYKRLFERLQKQNTYVSKSENRTNEKLVCANLYKRKLLWNNFHSLQICYWVLILKKKSKQIWLFSLWTKIFLLDKMRKYCYISNFLFYSIFQIFWELWVSNQRLIKTLHWKRKLRFIFIQLCIFAYCSFSFIIKKNIIAKI